MKVHNLWIDGNMKFIRRKAIFCVNAKDYVRFRYVEQSFGLNHAEELDVNANLLGAT